MKLLKRRDFIIGLSSLGFLGLLKWEYIYGYDKPDLAKKKGSYEIDCDYVLENGIIVDGTGCSAFVGNVGVKGDLIVAVGDFYAKDVKRINASGLIIAPGFIDIHTHTEDYWAAGGSGEMVLKQGVTTHIGGNCGSSVPSVGQYLSSLNQSAVNVGLFIGYKNLRTAVINREPFQVGSVELRKMKELIVQGMEEGAFGLSVGLSYFPQINATTEELIELCKIVKKYNGFYSTHIRNEDNTVIPSLKEAIYIGHRAKIPVEYSHVKTTGSLNWEKMPKILELLEQARNKGLDITADVYAYTYSSLDTAANKSIESMKEEDVILALQHPLVMVGSDSGLSREGIATHPRAYGNYSRIISVYVNKQKLLGLEQAIHKMTLMPARRLQLADRGTIAPGKKADIVAFNLAAVEEKASRQDPNRYSTGMKYVFVNGGLALEEGKITGVMAGKPLRHRFA